MLVCLKLMLAGTHKLAQDSKEVSRLGVELKGVPTAHAYVA